MVAVHDGSGCRIHLYRLWQNVCAGPCGSVGLENRKVKNIARLFSMLQCRDSVLLLGNFTR